MAEDTTAVPVEAPIEAPVEEPQQQVEEQEAEQPSLDGGRRAAKLGALEVARQRAEAYRQAGERAQEPAASAEPIEAEPAPKVDEHGRLHDPKTGEFVPKDEDTAVVATEASAAAPPTDGVQPPATEGSPKLTRIPLPEGHPLRIANGLEYIDATPEQERYVRWAMNKYVEAEQYKAELTEEREARMRLEARSSATEKWQQTPEYRHAVETYYRIAEQEGGDAANVYWRGQQSTFEALQRQEYDQQKTVVDAEEEARSGQTWINDTWQATERMPEFVRQMPSFQQMFNDQLKILDAAINAGSLQFEDGEKMRDYFFAEMLVPRVLRDPTVQAAWGRIQSDKQAQEKAEAQRKQAEAEAQRQRDLEAAKLAAQEQQKRDMATRRAAAPTNPLAKVGGGVPMNGTLPEVPADDSAASPQQLRRQGRQAAREAARQRFGT